MSLPLCYDRYMTNKTTNKMTAEDLLQQKRNKRDSLKLKRDSTAELAEKYQTYAARAEEEYQKRVRQVEAMEKRIEEGRKAREEADILRKKNLDRMEVDVEYRKSEECAEMTAKVVALDKIYWATTHEVAKINNGAVG